MLDFLPKMRTRPKNCRVHTFFDGQNLYRSASQIFGYRYPNFDPEKLSLELAEKESGRTLAGVYFYTGIHDASENPFWHNFWRNKLNAMERRGIHVVRRVLKYAEQPVEVSPGVLKKVRIGREKGIDIRIALDLVRLARHRQYDVAIIFSQDQDLAEAVTEVKAISREIDHWIRLESAFPVGPKKHSRRGINGTTWLPLDKALYDRCIDPTDYRPKRGGDIT